MNNRVEIKHYPFGRWSLTRELLDEYARTECSWCGGNGRFVYFVEPDDDLSGNRASEIKGVFCSKDCMATYHDFWDRE